jgi:hypothetical protein
MARFVQIGDEIVNLDQVVRVERSTMTGPQTVVIVYYTDDNEQTLSRFTDAQGEAVWHKFAELAERWDVPAAVQRAVAGPGRTERQV